MNEIWCRGKDGDSYCRKEIKWFHEATEKAFGTKMLLAMGAIDALLSEEIIVGSSQQCERVASVGVVSRLLVGQRYLQKYINQCNCINTEITRRASRTNI